MSLIYDLPFREGKGNQTKEAIRGNILPIHYVFNHAKYKANCSPNWVESPVSGYAVDFDGYSTYIQDQPLEVNGSFSISAFLAPRCFEACHGDVPTTIIDQLDPSSQQGFALSIFRHGEVQFELGDGRNIYRFRTDRQLELFIKSFLTVTFNQEEHSVTIYINGKKEIESTNIKHFRPADIALSIGLNNHPFEISDVFKGGMFAGLIDFIKVYNHARTDKDIHKEYEKIRDKRSVPLEDIELDEQKLLDDVHRPQYHAIPPQHWMNEPHAPFYYKGKYHLFYQKNASGPYFSHLHWGHWTSDDLVFWKNEKTALFPQKGDLTPSGVWSGSATIGPNNTPYLFYTFANFNKTYNQGVAIARPENIEDIHLVDWKMEPQGAIYQTDQQGMPAQFRDPFVWKDETEEKWYLIIGGGVKDKGPTAWVYTSTDCENWDFEGELFSVDSSLYPYLGTNWELPVLLPVRDQQGQVKYAFIFMSFFDDESKYEVDTYYYLGEFDKQKVEFIPDTKEPQLMDYGRFKFSGPSGFVDPVTNKTIVFSILQGDRNEQEEYDAGWAHHAGLPIELFLENQELRIQPLENLASLRQELLVHENNKSMEEVNHKLKNIHDKMLEILIEFEETENLVGLELKKDPTNQEKTKLLFDKAIEKVWLDRTESRKDKEGDIQGGPLKLDEGLKAHIFIDHSAVECYLNQKKMISSRAYPVLPNSDYLSIIGNTDTRIKSIKIFKLQSIWKNERDE
ncbi:GH32 C-terminal domain-containing protein [Gracilibacillus sp. YIM 98692]|uniref:GH32 C-terminal domain-containing protein n=1 Tax=Gracilibacillus sp. YIM 98692 TaxID=2663532 RepID=UPI0013D0C14D|nr:GH32 C-terminal domain-containing protein [Gracilibacillus sp. YIM 98692]